ncbi:CobW family GTP-binding protein [Vibrio porteresiae]|uniref:GTP-binding protein n=1 Tax=Vibrio porteresiae DSM 19223 TaxID=1123496 RepID=A0ABZ0Q8L1_9VIBR|nr:GTP-binding protein [Vibrio porteresiae]WPC72778.1 GTP-binding protein [Vibrio porteresiae DSM 19223]
MNPIPVVILSGFLGSGKTTLLRNLVIQSHQQNKPLGVIINELNAFDVDGALVENVDVVDKKHHSLISIAGESLSTPAGIAKLDGAISTLLTHHTPQLLIIETSGSAHPLPLIDYCRQQSRIKLTGVLSLMDSVMLAQDFADGQNLVTDLQANLMQGKRDITNLLAEQVLFASHVILTKTERLSPEQTQQIGQALQKINPYVPILAVSWGKLALAELMQLPTYRFSLVEQLIDELKEAVEQDSAEASLYQMETVLIEDDRPFHPQRLWDTYHHYLGKQIYRSKGFFWLATRASHALLWNQNAGSIGLEQIGTWRSAILEQDDNGLTPEERRILQAKIEQHNGRFGDRRCRLIVIGDKAQLTTFTKALQRCFLTESEIQDWQQGTTFPDPWPKTTVMQ